MASIDWVNLDFGLVPIQKVLRAGFKLSKELEIDTGEIRDYPLVGELDCLTYIAKSDKYIRLNGSFHKLWNIWSNRVYHNANQFPFEKQLETIKEFTQLLNVNASEIPVVGLEYGLNLSIPYDAKDFIKHYILTYGWKRPTLERDFGPKGYLKEFDLSKIYLKIYAKGYQYGLENNLIRIEIKTKSKAEYIQKKGIFTLDDLNKESIFIKLHSDLIEKAKNLIILDSNTLTKLNASQYEKILDPNYWERLHPSPKDYKEGSKDPGYAKDRRIANSTKRNILKKVEEVGGLTAKQELLQGIERQKDTLFILSPRPELVTNDNLLRCKITGKDISNQRKGSKFISEKYHGKKEAKRARNADSNPRNNLKRKIQKTLSSNTLFDIEPYLILTKELKEILDEETLRRLGLRY